MNTKFCYLYRDACNYKKFYDIILHGILDKNILESFLKDKMFFIPSEVGLPDLQDDVFTVDDHIWHEIENIELTEADPTTDIMVSSLLKKFRKASKNNWNEYEVMKKKGLI